MWDRHLPWLGLPNRNCHLHFAPTPGVVYANAFPALSAHVHAQALAALQDRIAHRFHDPALLLRAVTHPSFLAENPDASESNQRLEFLGDAVLLLILTDEIFQLFSGDREGALTRRRAALMQGSLLARLARELSLGDCLRLSAGEARAGGRDRAAALEDAMEALIGALYLDAGLPTTRTVILAIYGPLSDRLDAAVGRPAKSGLTEPETLEASNDWARAGAENPKGRLQELVQPLHGNEALRYEVVVVGGTAHAREFEVAVWLLANQLGTGRGSSKKQAEEAAARVALANWRSV